MRTFATILAVAFSIVPRAGTASQLGLTSATANPGTQVVLPLSLLSSTGTTAGLEWMITAPTSDVTSVATTIAPAAAAAGKSISCSGNRCVVVGGTAAIPNGVVANVTLTLAAAATGNLAVQISGGSEALSDGTAGTLSTSDGVLAVNSTTPVSIAISPASVQVGQNGSQQFTAAITGSTSAVPTWTLAGPGILSATGLYTAPATITSSQTAIVQVSVNANGSGTASASATLTLVPPAISISASPSSVTLGPGQTQQCSATVTGSANTTVTWALSGPGTLSSTGMYAAPATITSNQTATVKATSVADPTKSASLTVTLNPPAAAVSVSISPTSVQMGIGGTQQFTGAVGGTTNTGLTWTLTGPGTLSSAGLYTAPSNITGGQTATITATSVADATKTAQSTVALVLAIRVNSGGKAYANPSGVVWSADTGYKNPGSAYCVTASIAGTTDQPLYRCERQTAPNFSYQFPVSPGTYTVTLKFAAISMLDPGKRVFDISVNGVVVDANFDPRVAAGAAYKAVDRTYVVTLKSGKFILSLTPISGSTAAVNAIQIVPGLPQSGTIVVSQVHVK